MASHIQKTEKRKSVLYKNSKYRKNTDTGFTTGAWEAHHILCYKSVRDREVGENQDFVEDCLWITDWDLNDAHNMVGLPKNSQYRLTNGMVPLNLPSHQVDHNTSDGYRNEVTMWIKTNVWDSLNDKKKDHEVNAKDIKDALKKGSDHFRKQLTLRGIREDGTLHCWQHRFPNPPDPNDENYEQVEEWYLPFSMADDPTPRNPGIDFSKLTGIFKKFK